MTLHEPATFATDVVLSAWSTWLGFRLRGDEPAVRWWRRTFYWTAFASLAGGIYHGLGPNFPGGAEWLWRVTLLAISVTSLCLTLATIHATFGHGVVMAQRIAAVKFAGCVIYAMIRPEFLSAIIDYGSAMLFVLTMELHAWLRHRAAHGKWIAAGVGISVLGAVVQQLHLAPHPAFNHNDLYHVIQMIGLGAFFRGARLLR